MQAYLGELVFRISSLPINAYSTRWYQGVLEHTGYKLFNLCCCEGNGFQVIKSGIGNSFHLGWLVIKASTVL